MADYELNKGFIAKNLCENRARPWLHCNGQCQLMKKLRKEEKKDQTNPNRRQENNNEVYPFKSFVEYAFNGPVLGRTIFFHITSKPVDRAIPIFHPPQLA
jgi:hypothetical protein